MSYLNKIMLIGNLTRDPELRVTPKGTAVCQFGIATNRKYKNSDTGETSDEVCFFDCEAWGRTAETIDKYLQKGAPIFVEGRMKLDQWEDKQSGQKRSKLKVVVESFQFLGSKNDGGGDGDRGERRDSGGGGNPQRSAYESRGSGERSNRSAPRQENIDEDVPFN